MTNGKPTNLTLPGSDLAVPGSPSAVAPELPPTPTGSWGATLNAPSAPAPASLDPRGSHQAKLDRAPNHAPSTRPPDGDVLPRRRDQLGNRLKGSFVFTRAYVEDVPLERSHLRHLIEQVAERSPAWAAQLRWRYDELLRPTYRRYREVLEWAERLKEQRRQAMPERRAQLEAALQEQAVTGAAQLEREQAELADRLAQLEASHAQAGQAVSACGGVYDPANPGPDSLLQAPVISRAEVLGRRSLPDPGNDREGLLPPALEHLGTILVACLLGMSLGILCGMLNPETLLRKWPMALICAVVALGPAYFMRKTVVNAFRLVGEGEYTQRPPVERFGQMGVAIGWLLTLLAVDLQVEFCGLLKLAQADAALSALSGGPVTTTSQVVFYCVAAVVSIGYLGYSAYQGYLLGRRQVIENLVAAEQAEMGRDHERARRQDPSVCQALSALAGVREATRRVELQRARLGQLQADSQRARAELQARLSQIGDDLTPTEQHLVQDAYDNLLGAQQNFEALLAAQMPRRRWYWLWLW